MKYFKALAFLLIVVILSAGLYLGHMIKPASTLAQSDRTVEREEGLELENTVNPFKGTDILHILVLGVDKDASTVMSRSDTIMLLSLDPKRERSLLLSLPRDTRVVLPNDPNPTKLGHAYAYGGHKMAMETVENFLDIDIDYYATVDYDAVRRLVDEIGGVEVDIPADYSHTDSANDTIEFKKGLQKLNGREAVHYLRMRKIYEDADLARIQTQQDFLMTVFKKVKSPATIFKIPELIRIAMDNLETNLNYGQIAYIAQFGLGLDEEQIVTETLVGEKDVRIDGLSYYLVDQKTAQTQLEEFTSGGTPSYFEEAFGTEIKVNPEMGHVYIGD